MYHNKSTITDLSKFQVLPVEWMAGPKSSLFPTGPIEDFWGKSSAFQCLLTDTWYKLVPDVCLFLRYFLHFRTPFLRLYFWGKGKISNEWKLSSICTSRTYPNISIHPLLSNQRNISLRIKSKSFMLPTKLYVIWSLSLLHILLWQNGFSSNIPLFQACSRPWACVLSSHLCAFYPLCLEYSVPSSCHG